MFNLFRDKSEKISSEQTSLNPASSTGFLASISSYITAQIKEIPISFNGQSSSDDWTGVTELQNGSVVKFRNPKGGKEPQVIINPRCSEFLLSSDGGKISITGTNRNEFVLVDFVHSGSKLNSAVAVGRLRMTSAHDSTVTSARQADSSTIPNTSNSSELGSKFIGPKYTPGFIGPIYSGPNSKLTDAASKIIKSPNLPGPIRKLLNPVTGMESISETDDHKNVGGSNSRTGTFNLGLSNLVSMGLKSSLGGF